MELLLHLKESLSHHRNHNIQDLIITCYSLLKLLNHSLLENQSVSKPKRNSQLQFIIRKKVVKKGKMTEKGEKKFVVV